VARSDRILRGPAARTVDRTRTVCTVDCTVDRTVVRGVDFTTGRTVDRTVVHGVDCTTGRTVERTVVHEVGRTDDAVGSVGSRSRSVRSRSGRS
jgi:hypothetical protein